jgi:hypothetical protein
MTCRPTGSARYRGRGGGVRAARRRERCRSSTPHARYGPTRGPTSGPKGSSTSGRGSSVVGRAVAGAGLCRPPDVQLRRTGPGFAARRCPATVRVPKRAAGRPGAPNPAGPGRAAVGGSLRRTSASQGRPRTGSRSSARRRRSTPTGPPEQDPRRDLADHQGYAQPGQRREQRSSQPGGRDQREEPERHAGILRPRATPTAR